MQRVHARQATPSTGSEESLIRAFKREAALHPLLTREGEVELARRVENANHTFSSGEVAAAKEALVVSNLRLVLSYSRQFLKRGVALPDLLQEGTLGLMRAVEKYDFRLGFRFATYASWWVRQSLARAVAQHSRTIRLPLHVTGKATRMARLERSHANRSGQAVDPREIAAQLGISAHRAEAIRAAMAPPASLDTPMTSDTHTSLGEMLEDPGIATPEQQTIHNLMRRHLEDLLRTLPPREESLLRMRFGLGACTEWTLEEIGRLHNVSKERVRQMEINALRRLRFRAKNRQLDAYL